jgi:Ca-activated chloride channel family protein
MSVRAGLLLFIAVVALVHPSVAWAQAEERSVYASVLDRVGTPVTTLTATDFMVREDGIEREVLRVSPATDPLRIAVLVDTSQAIRPHLNDVRSSLRQFVADMHGKHEIALYEFGERPQLLVDYTIERARLEAGIGRVFARPGSGAHLLDAIIDVSRDVRKREGARTAIVVITAEGPEFSDRYYRTVLDELLETDSALHALVLSRRRASPLNHAARERELTLAEGARMTGGRRDYLLTSMALTARLRELGTELDNEYRVVYARPATLIAPEEIDVDVTRPGLMVRAPQVLPKDDGREAIRAK